MAIGTAHPIDYVGLNAAVRWIASRFDQMTVDEKRGMRPVGLGQVFDCRTDAAIAIDQ